MVKRFILVALVVLLCLCVADAHHKKGVKHKHGHGKEKKHGHGKVDSVQLALENSSKKSSHEHKDGKHHHAEKKEKKVINHAEKKEKKKSHGGHHKHDSDDRDDVFSHVEADPMVLMQMQSSYTKHIKSEEEPADIKEHHSKKHHSKKHHSKKHHSKKHHHKGHYNGDSDGDGFPTSMMMLETGSGKTEAAAEKVEAEEKISLCHPALNIVGSCGWIPKSDCKHSGVYNRNNDNQVLYAMCSWKKDRNACDMVSANKCFVENQSRDIYK